MRLTSATNEFTEVTVTYDNPEDPSKVYNTYLHGMSSGTKPLTGYSQGDLQTDTGKTGEAPSSIKTTSLEMHGHLEIGVSAGAGGASVGVSAAASSYTTVYKDGSVGSGLDFQGSADVTGKLDMGPIETHAATSALASGEVEILRDSAGHPVSVTVSYAGTTTVEVGATAYGHDHTNSVDQTWVRTETFSYDDPRVKAVFGSDPDPISAIGIAGQHADLSSQTFASGVTKTEADNQGLGGASIGSSTSEGETMGEWYRDPGSNEWHRQKY